MKPLVIALFSAFVPLIPAAELAPFALPPILTPPDAPEVQFGPPPAPRRISPETAAKLAAVAPKPQVPVAETPAIRLEPLRLGSPPDQARNMIFRLPSYVVTEPRMHLPTPLQTLTVRGRVEHAFDRRPGLRFVPFAWLNAAVALEMLEDDLAAERAAAAGSLMSLYRITVQPPGNNGRPNPVKAAAP